MRAQKVCQSALSPSWIGCQVAAFRQLEDTAAQRARVRIQRMDEDLRPRFKGPVAVARRPSGRARVEEVADQPALTRRVFPVPLEDPLTRRLNGSEKHNPRRSRLLDGQAGISVHAGETVAWAEQRECPRV
jgi:hypothetical protein